jgi:hypothetical protein
MRDSLADVIGPDSLSTVTITYTKKKHLTSDMIKGLYTTPQILVPGIAGKIMNVLSVTAVFDYQAGLEDWNTSTGAIFQVYCYGAEVTLFQSNDTFYTTNGTFDNAHNLKDGYIATTTQRAYLDGNNIMLNTSADMITGLLDVGTGHPINIYVTYTITTL